jgi:hypothetical protein
MNKSFFINCSENVKDPYKLGKIGIDNQRKPVLLLWCRRHRIEHACSLAQLLQSWRGMAEGDQQALLSQQGILQAALAKIQADLEDLEQQQAAG